MPSSIGSGRKKTDNWETGAVRRDVVGQTPAVTGNRLLGRRTEGASHRRRCVTSLRTSAEGATPNSRMVAVYRW
jgi:hypothetical protein